VIQAIPRGVKKKPLGPIKKEKETESVIGILNRRQKKCRVESVHW
jgi:hypothetical protein